MPRLMLPCIDVRLSFIAAIAEFIAEGRGAPNDDSMISQDLRAFGPTWNTEEGFAHYVAALREQSLEATPRRERCVPCTTLWAVQDADYIGRLASVIVSPAFTQRGGHIGYDVRPSARRRGHATATLKGGLHIAHTLGIDRALITCEGGNIASRKVIEANGGVLEDEPQGGLRFWAPAAREGTPPHES